MDQVPGIDVSEFNGAIDWQQVAASGVRFAMIRAGYGLGHTDKRAQEYLRGAGEAGLDIGAYWFSYALSEAQAQEEAKYLLEVTAPYKLTYPLAYDYEYDSIRYAQENGRPVTRELVTAYARAFCNTLRENKFYPAYYSNADFLKNYFDSGRLSDIDLWYAYYQSSAGRDDMGLWQHASTGSVPGITGKVDLDYALRDYPAILREGGWNALEPTVNPQDHWAYGAYEYLARQYGFYLNDMNFDRAPTMGEVLTVVARVHGYQDESNADA